MGTEDRDWHRKDRSKRARLVWNEGRGELRLEDNTKRRWRLRAPFWLREVFRLLGYLAATFAIGWILIYLVLPLLVS